MQNDFLEKDLEDMIFENKNIIHERGFTKFYKHCERQFTMPNGGIVDMITWDTIDNQLFIKIIELKRGTIDQSAFDQLMGYYYDVIIDLHGAYKHINIEIILVGNNAEYYIDHYAQISNIFNYYIYSYDYNGIKFKKCEKDIGKLLGNRTFKQHILLERFNSLETNTMENR